MSPRYTGPYGSQWALAQESTIQSLRAEVLATVGARGIAYRRGSGLLTPGLFNRSFCTGVPRSSENATPPYDRHRALGMVLL